MNINKNYHLLFFITHVVTFSSFLVLKCYNRKRLYIDNLKIPLINKQLCEAFYFICTQKTNNDGVCYNETHYTFNAKSL